MRITADGEVYSDDGIHLGRVRSGEDIADKIVDGVLKSDGDGGYSSVSNSSHVCNCGCGRPISAFADFFSGGSAGATSECSKRIKESAEGIRKYLQENNLTVPSPSGGLMTPDDVVAEKARKQAQRDRFKK